MADAAAAPVIETPNLGTYQAVTWSLTGVILVALTGFACIYSYLRRRKLKGSMRFNSEEFITARGQANALRLGWSFFAGALGAWVVSSPPYYAGSGFNFGAGFLGLVFYSLAAGLPLLMIAFAGSVIKKKVPHVLSLTDFIGWRFGWVAKTYVVLFCLFNMSIAILAEYTTIGALFGTYLGSVAWAIVVLVGLLTMLYTTYGGLFVSIVTDQVQGLAVCVLTAFLVIYVAATYRFDLPIPVPDDCSISDANPAGICVAGTNKVGYSSIFVMPASLFTATVFSEAMWQRAWASVDRPSLIKGSIAGCCGVSLITFFFGFCGILTAWGGLLPATWELNGNLYLFPALQAINANNEISKWVGVVVILLAVCMNMSAVDSLQNGLTAGFSSHLLKGRPVAYTKVAVLLLNVPLIVLGTLGATPKSGGAPNEKVLDLKVLDLFLLANMMCCTSALPVLSGLFDSLHPYLGGGSMVFSGVFSFFCTSWYGVDYFNRNFAQIKADNEYYGKYQSQNFGNAINYTWMGNFYSWDFFLVPLGVSLGSLILCGCVNAALQRFTRCKPALMGFTAPATHPDLYPDADAEIEERPIQMLSKAASSIKRSASGLARSMSRSNNRSSAGGASAAAMAAVAEVAEAKGGQGSPKAPSSDDEVKQ